MGEVRTGLILILFSLVSIERCSSSKVLLIIGSRHIYCHEIGVIGAELLNRGYDVTIYLRDDIDYRRCIDIIFVLNAFLIRDKIEKWMQKASEYTKIALLINL